MAARVLQNTLNQYPLASTLLANNAFKSAFANRGMTSFMSSPVSANISSASSGYSTSDETYSHTESSIKTEASDDSDAKRADDITGPSGSKLSLAHIMNWVKSEPSADNVNGVATKVLNAALKWTKTQKNFSSLPHCDQNVLISQSIQELFILQMAENNFSLCEAVFDEDNIEKKQLIQEFQKTLNKFAEFKVDLMEFYLLKSIILFKSGNLIN